ncbi:Sedlin [Aspergillus spinulosporus]
MPGPKIACIGVIGKADNPLHTSLFPPYLGSAIDFSFLLNSSLDIFEIRQKQTSVDQDLGLLQAVDERLASYGWITTTGVKFLIIVDLIGDQTPSVINETRGSVRSGIREADLKPAFRALQTAYIRLLQNPFYTPDDHAATINGAVQGTRTSQITDQRFIAEVNRVGNSWTAVTNNL